MIGVKIKQVVENQKKYSNAELAKMIGVSENNLYRLYKRDSVETKYIEKLCQVTGVSILTFFEDTGSLPVNQSTGEGGVNQHRSISGSIRTNTAIDPKTDIDLNVCLERVKGLEREVSILREVNQNYAEMLKKK
jgi:DNA-binding Xre family transcriptional regulator